MPPWAVSTIVALEFFEIPKQKMSIACMSATFTETVNWAGNQTQGRRTSFLSGAKDFIPFLNLHNNFGLSLLSQDNIRQTFVSLPG